MKKHILEINELDKNFGSFQALKGVTLRCTSGKIYGLVGRNGSGKTVLLKCICGFLQADSGEILLDGKKRKKGELLRNAGIIIEEPAFLENASGIRNLEYLYRINHAWDRKKVESIMQKVGLEPNERKKVCKYSLGMRQRLAIAQALMEDPEILILDEPMNGLDKLGVARMRELFAGQREKGKMIFLASHNKDDIDILCDEVFEMEDGIIL